MGIYLMQVFCPVITNFFGLSSHKSEIGVKTSEKHSKNINSMLLYASYTYHVLFFYLDLCEVNTHIKELNLNDFIHCLYSDALLDPLPNL
jgi:hypothetical protein